jgi:hypothetical protein
MLLSANVCNGWKVDIDASVQQLRLGNMRPATLAFLLAGSACAAQPHPRSAAVDTAGVGATFIVTGRLRFLDGDRLLIDCGRREACEEMLVRDERLQREVVALQGRRLTLRVQRVEGCGAASSEAVCVRGARTALRILEWISPQQR